MVDFLDTGSASSVAVSFERLEKRTGPKADTQVYPHSKCPASAEWRVVPRSRRC